MNVVNLTIFAIFLLVIFYKNWIPGMYAWVQDRVHE